MAKLGEVFPVIRNGASIKQESGAGGFPITRIETISNRTVNRSKMGYAGIFDIEKYQDYVLQDGDILMSHINSEAHLGKVALYTKQGNEQIIHGMNLLMLRSNSKKLLPEYAKYYFESWSFLRQIQRITKKSVNQASFTVTALKEVEIPCVDIDAQKEIVKRLQNLEQLISLRKQQLAKLDELVKARFVEMFGDLASPACSWKKEKIVNICADQDDIKCGPFGTQLSKDAYQSTGVSVWEIPQINSNFLLKPTHFITAEKALQLEAYSIIPGDIAMSRKGNVGRCAVFPENLKNGIIHSDVLRIRIDKKRAVPTFMMHQLHNSNFIKHQIELVSSGAIMAGINVTKLKEIEVHLPPLTLQNEFATFVERVDQQKQTIQQSLEKLELMKKALMQEYFG